MYARRLRDLRSLFHDTHASDLVGALRRHRDSGRLEILTSAATHGLLPLLGDVPQAVGAQVRVGVAHHREVLGHDPTGFWLPECGYEPGLEGQLRKAGLSYSFLDAHGLTDARPRPSWGALAPVFSPGGVVFFGRDVESSRQVWSAKVGFPGHPDYREFYRDVGWDLPLDYLDDFLGDGRRQNLGIKYHRVTGQVDLGAKEIYDRCRALQRVAVHAEEFLSSRRRQIQDVAGAMSRPPIVVSAYDAELFGHWWFEGPEFLEALFRGLEAHAEVFVAVTPSEFLESFPDCEETQPPMSTWGAGGYAGVWLDPANDWIYSHLRVAAERMVALARRHPEPDALTRRALNQAARELLLAQSSDWAFMMATGTTVEYAERRTRDHLGRFSLLHAALEGGGLDERVLREIEARDNLFPNIDYRVYR
jgi:1,4-alpha-glucan branching enzyme